VAATTSRWVRGIDERRSLRKLLPAVFLLAPALVLLGVFFIYPLETIFERSITEPTSGFDNYTALWSNEAFRRILQTTFVIAFETTIVCVVLAYPVAYLLSDMPRRLANVLVLLSLVPFCTATLARLFAWTIILGRRGIINNFLADIGLIDEPLDLLFSRPAVIIGMAHLMLPYMIIILYSTMISIDRNLLDASRSFGASGWQTFRRVFLPLSMPGVYAGALLVFVVSLGFYLTPALLGGGGDLTMALYINQEVHLLKFGVAGAMSMVLLVITISLFVVFDRLFGTAKLVQGALKR
jgi:ABC-type spermidine/putrescine transport system permease subunit I